MDATWAYCPEHGYYSPPGLRPDRVENWRVAHNVTFHRGSDAALIVNSPAPADVARATREAAES